jgi:hypothetical protein
MLNWLLRCLNPRGGLFAYLTSRDQNRAKIQLEKTRQESTASLIRQLPNGAVFRDGTTDSWREIWMPPALPPSALFLLTAEQEQPQARRPGTSHQLPEEIYPCQSPDDEMTQLTAGQHPKPAE